jgi:hypothetical protein
MPEYQVLKKEDGLFISKRGEEQSSLVRMGPLEDCEAIVEAFAEFMGKEYFGE